MVSDRIDDDIRDLVEHIRHYKSKITAFERQIDLLRVELSDRLHMKGENWADNEDYAHIISASRDSKYDSGALDKLIDSDPQSYGWLKNFRISSSSPHMQVK